MTTSIYPPIETVYKFKRNGAFFTTELKSKDLALKWFDHMQRITYQVQLFECSRFPDQKLHAFHPIRPRSE
jgi:hypothetical protein